LDDACDHEMQVQIAMLNTEVLHPPHGQVLASVAQIPQQSSAGLGLQRWGPSGLLHPEQQEPPQALSIVRGTVHHRGGALTRHLQAQGHRW